MITPASSTNNLLGNTNEQIQDYIGTLSGLLNRFKSPPSVVIFAGAGVSIPSGLPSARRFIDDVISECSVSSELPVLKRFLDRENPDRLGPGDWLRFEGVTEAFSKTFDPDLTSLEIFQTDAKPNSNHRILAHLLEAGHTVLTTNFDCLIEQACRDLGIEIKVAFLPEHFKQNTIAQATNDSLPYPLCKLHGSIEDRASLQASLSRIGRNGMTFDQDSPIRRFLVSIIANHDVFVVGYSGTDDYDIVPLFIQTDSSASLLWIAHQSNTEHCRALSVDELQDWPRDQLGFLFNPIAAILEGIVRTGGRNPNQLRMLLADGTVALLVLGEILLSFHEKVSNSEAGKAIEHRNVALNLSSSFWKNPSLNEQTRNVFTARLYRSFGRVTESIPLYLQALEVWPRPKGIESAETDYESWLELVEVILDQAGSENGVQEDWILQKIMFISQPPTSMPLSAIVWIALMYELAGYLHESRKNFEEAMKFYDRALESLRNKNPLMNRIPNILAHKGRILRKQSAFGQAVDCFYRARDLFLKAGQMGDVAHVLWEMFLCYKDRGEGCQAADVLESCRHFAVYGGNYEILKKTYLANR